MTDAGKALLEEVCRLERERRPGEAAALILSKLNGPIGSPDFVAAMEVGEIIASGLHRPNGLGSIHTLAYALPNGCTVRLSVQIDAINGEDVTYTAQRLGEADPRALCAEVWKKLVPLIEADVRSIVLGRREPPIPCAH